jgi:hypothetical protein
VPIAFQTEKMLGRATKLRIEHSPAIAYEPLLGIGYVAYYQFITSKFAAFFVGARHTLLQFWVVCKLVWIANVYGFCVRCHFLYI